MNHWGVTLYHRANDPNHWILHSRRGGWLRFPAKFGGWAEREPCPATDRSELQAIPTWLAFNTGLLEAIIAEAA